MPPKGDAHCACDGARPGGAPLGLAAAVPGG
jgi:hypothetical protein